ncbi:response regulator [Aquisalinus flavus]|uniref:histidine kinase n=1 Tax=Aquisalinus flavus TaxID=1526572 RepID=A0A8J2V7U5_9PROT|nr:response regulator [Aquisalinus flavus]MBD0425315.1 response regulator [Aquisalinus flavus]UNE49032.1 response regulator [Aquisalinus flavus]GGD17057.1 hypothetical protein GCM10011342_27290 [Aquisalinus flavus]
MKFWKLTFPAALGLALLLMLTGAAFMLYGERASSAQKIDEVRMQADILSAIVPAALAFDDTEAAMDYLNALRANPEIRGAALYDENDVFFAGFRLGTWQYPDSPPADGYVQEQDRVIVTAPVVQDGTRMGTVIVRSAAEPLATRMMRYTSIILLFSMGVLLLGVVWLATRALTSANATLAARADDLTRANAELKSQIEQREQAEEALRQSQKMETLGQLTGGIAHDFNNLLTIVLGNLERVIRTLTEKGETQLAETAENAQRGARRAASLTQSLLAFARRQPLDPRSVDINVFVNEMSSLMKRTMGETIAIETVIGAGLWKVCVDPNQLESAILNLAVNARDAMPEGGKLTIETANAYVDRQYITDHAGLEIEPGQYVLLCISDTGTGMDEETIEKAFEPFFTTKGVGHGTGLGLSQLYGFVKQSGGHVKIYSERGNGTTFKLYFPRHIPAEDEEPVQERRKEVPRGNGELVLVVEDEDDVRAHTVALVEELGYRAVDAPDGKSALGQLDRHPEIALLFTDVGLPDGMNGRQLSDEACSRRPDLKVLYTTGYARNAIIHDGRLDQGLHLVTKPFTYEEAGFAMEEAMRTKTQARKILIVEDEGLILADLVMQMEDFGIPTLEAVNGKKAEEIARRERSALRAVVVDLGLPDMRGDALTEKLLAMDPSLKIVIASGYAPGEVRTKFAGDSRVTFVEKPYNAKALLDALNIKPGRSA